MRTIHTSQDTERSELGQELILTLSLDEEIIQFNKESERLTGYSRDEILHKKFDEMLVPLESKKEWKDLLDSIRHSMWIDSFILPLKTKNNQTHMVSWTGFLVKDENGVVKDICIFGKPLKSDVVPTPPPVVIAQAMSTPQVPRETPESEAEGSENVSEQSFHQLPRPASPSNVPPSESPGVTPEFTAVETHQDSHRSAMQSLQETSLPAEVSSEEPPEVSFESPQIKSQDGSQEKLKKGNTEVIMKHRVKKILFASKNRDEESTTQPVQKQFITPLITMGKLLETTSQKLDFMNETLRDLSEKYETVTNRVTELERKDRRWERKQKKTEKSFLSDAADETDTHRSENGPKELDVSEQDFDGKQQGTDTEFTFFSDPFGLKRQHKELDLKKQQLEIHFKELEASKAQLQKQQHIFNVRVEEFSKWREKLMLLESAIENRRQELMKQENAILAGGTVPRISHEQHPRDLEPSKEAETKVSNDTDETLDKISQSAAIIQRGIIKQINNPFVEFLRLPREEIVEKSFFDFIALEGLAEVEKYYLDRLKGEDVSLYKTVFSTKNNTKIPVEVSIKQTIYNGEKAEIVIITTSTT